MAATRKRLPHAPSVRLTPLGAALLALAFAVPGGTLAGLVAWLAG